MKTLALTLASAAFVLTPAIANACNYPVCSTYQHADVWGSGADDPDIPNCVAGPDKNYADGECEHVQIWLNFGNQSATCTMIRGDIGRRPS